MSERDEGNIQFALVDLTQRDLDEYYAGFANRALWPLLHYRLDLADFERQDMTGYFRVNALFARVLASRLQPDDVIWVQDYHLIPLAAELRALGVEESHRLLPAYSVAAAGRLVAMPVIDRLLEPSPPTI